MTISRDSVLDDVINSYKSLDRPEYDFVQDAAREKLRRHVFETIGSRLLSMETTEPNIDVCLNMSIRGAVFNWVLQLSMVGPYALLVRGAGTDEWCSDVVDFTASLPVDTEEEFLKRAVEGNGFQFLGLEEISWPFCMALFDTPSENVRLYQVLFSDVDLGPSITSVIIRSRVLEAPC